MLFVQRLNESGDPAATIFFDGEEQFGSICPECGTHHALEYGDFWWGASEHGLHSVCFRCDECSAKNKLENEPAKKPASSKSKIVAFQKPSDF